jgi:hypothetical protein
MTVQSRKGLAPAVVVGLCAHMRELADACLYLFDRSIAALSGGRARLRKYYFIAQPVSTKRWLPPQRGASVEIRRLSASDPLIKELPRPDWVISYRFQQGALCLAALKERKCIGYLWLTLGPYQEDEVRCRYVPLPEGKASWDFDVYVDPEHRSSIVFLKLWDEANRLLAGHEIRWSLSRISAFNTASMSAHARMGAKRIGAAVFLSMGPLQICAATAAPYFAISRQRDSFPTFALNPEAEA